jgi:hypothetical protein
MTTLYGIYNVCFYAANNPKPRYYLTRERRDTALAALRERAVEGGLSRSAARTGIYPVKCRTQNEMALDAAHENEAEEVAS